MHPWALSLVGCETNTPTTNSSTQTPTQGTNEPLGGQPAAGAKQSVPDLDEQVVYQRAFEAVLWAMPASAVYGLRTGILALPGIADNVVLVYSSTMKPKDELITANTDTPYIAAAADLRKGRDWNRTGFQRWVRSLMSGSDYTALKMHSGIRLSRCRMWTGEVELNTRATL
jgi:hypothetical protein